MRQKKHRIRSNIGNKGKNGNPNGPGTVVAISISQSPMVDLSAYFEEAKKKFPLAISGLIGMNPAEFAALDFTGLQNRAMTFFKSLGITFETGFKNMNSGTVTQFTSLLTPALERAQGELAELAL